MWNPVHKAQSFDFGPQSGDGGEGVMGGKEMGRGEGGTTDGERQPLSLPAPPNNQNKSKLFLLFSFPR